MRTYHALRIAVIAALSVCGVLLLAQHELLLAGLAFGTAIGFLLDELR